MPDAFREARTDYAAARPSRFRRRRSGVPSSGAGYDYHIRTDRDLVALIEDARELDRNDRNVGYIVDRAVTNVVQSGFRLDVDTGDAKLDADLKARWREWADEPLACDVAGERTFSDFESATWRATIVDGDHVVLGTSDNRLQSIEAHRIRSPHRTKRNVVHGVLLNEFRQRLEYWIAPDTIEAHKQILVRDLQQRRTFAESEELGRPVRQVFHVHNAKRTSATRGVTAFAPMFDVTGMLSDIQFAELVRRQVIACFAVFREQEAREGIHTPRGKAGERGEVTTERLPDGGVRILEGIAPGMEIRGEPGEKLAGFSPDVPGESYFPFVREQLAAISLNLGLPLIVAMLDASETNFSGWRGAVDQARLGFRQSQQRLIRRFHRPVWTWWLAQQLRSDRALQLAASRGDVNILRHSWTPPSWPYIEPLKDAQADSHRLEHRLTSPRRLHKERGVDYPELVREIVDDNAAMVAAAMEKAAELRGRYPDAELDWRELLEPRGRQMLPADNSDEEMTRADDATD